MASYNEHLARYHAHAAELGLTYAQADAMRRDAQRLHGINERECNGTLQRIEELGQTDHKGRPLKVGKVYNVWGQDRPGPIMYAQTRDMETPARERIEATAAGIGAVAVFNADPRGWPVHLEKDGAELWPPVRG